MLLDLESSGSDDFQEGLSTHISKPRHAIGSCLLVAGVFVLGSRWRPVFSRQMQVRLHVCTAEQTALRLHVCIRG